MRPNQRASLEPGRYFARNIEDLVVEIYEVLTKRIARKKLVDELEIISPAGGLGRGYYINFVKPVVCALGQLTSLSIDGEQIDITKPARQGKMRLHIMIPPRIHLLKPSAIAPLSSVLKQCQFPVVPGARLPSAQGKLETSINLSISLAPSRWSNTGWAVACPKSSSILTRTKPFA
jgi:hypothetical protein